jgi:hypothetical protein
VKCKTDVQRNVCVSAILYNSLECGAFWVRVPCSLVCGYCLMGENYCFHRQVGLWIYATAQYHNPDYQSIKSHLVNLMSRIIINMIMIIIIINNNNTTTTNTNTNNNNNNMQHTSRALGT